MSVFAIPNPRKILHIDSPLGRVKESAKNISLLNSKYKLHSCNEIFNQYTYESFEFMSLGVYIDINLNAISENKIEITVEVRRKLGTFNESHEVTHANNHIVNISNYMARITSMSFDDILKLKSQQSENTKHISLVKAKSKKEKNIASLLSFFLGGFGVHRFYLGQTLIGFIYLIFCWTFIPGFIALIDFFVFVFMSKNKFDLKYNN